jgi:hypothetical protein
MRRRPMTIRRPSTRGWTVPLPCHPTCAEPDERSIEARVPRDLLLRSQVSYGVRQLPHLPRIIEMFYQLSHVDGTPLPCNITIDKTTFTVDRGGLLLEPPRQDKDIQHEAQGRSSLKLFGRYRVTDTPDFIGSSDEPYRWISDHELSISRRGSDEGARFNGSVDGNTLTLCAAPTPHFIPAATVLRFTTAPEAPIGDEWASQFDFGPPRSEPVEPWRRSDPAELAAIQEWIAAGEAARRRAARERLELAWRAPA